VTVDGWRDCKLGDVVTLKRGYDLPRERRVPGSFPIVSSAGVTGSHAEAKVRGPGVVTGRYGTLGEVYFIDEDFWPLNTALYVRDFKGNDPRFISYFLRLLDLGTRNAAGAVPGVNRNHLHAMEVRVPLVPTQRRIAAVLSEYDDLIENCERRIRLLDEMARALYREWFVLLRYPGHEKTPLVDTLLGRIPKTWAVEKLGNVVRVHRGRSYRSTDLAADGGVPFVNLKCVARDGGFRRDGLKRFVGAAPESHAVRRGDIVVAVTDMTQERRIVARAVLVPTLGADFGVLSMDLVRVEPLRLPATWLYALLRFSRFADHLKQHANGANVLHLSSERIRDHVVAVPPAKLADGFAARVASLFELHDVLESRIANLRSARDLLLPRFLSGQLEPPDAA
jgi:type I restriction enzyme, S subunit